VFDIVFIIPIFLFHGAHEKKNPLEHCINIFVVTAVVMVDHFSHQVALEE
jgi:hypothetical protein